MGSVREALEAERKLEQEFVDQARQSEKAPKGWPAALIMFHLGMWRERLHSALLDVEAGREHTPPPENIDEINDEEMGHAIGTPLTDAAARSDHLLGAVIDAYERIGERPFKWYVAQNTTEAVLRNSITHPSTHLYRYKRENGDDAGAAKVFEDVYSQLRALPAPPIVMDVAQYNYACARAIQGKVDDAIAELQQLLSRREDMRKAASSDNDLEPLRADPRFQELIKT